MSNICYANRKNRCRILNVNKCISLDCAFIKTVEEHRDGLKWTNNRIASLDKVTQKHIADTYHKGEYPWLKGGDNYGC